MRIAVTSQNRYSITPHAGKCRHFWVYDIAPDQQSILKRTPLLLTAETLEQRVHAFVQAGIETLISGSIGKPFFDYLRENGIHPLTTTLHDPDIAIAACISGTLEPPPPEAGAHCPHLPA